MKLVLQDQTFICRCSFHERHLPKEAGFYWHPSRSEWSTQNVSAAAKLREYADDDTKKILDSVLIKIYNNDYVVEPPIYDTLLAYQEHGARFIQTRSVSYVGDVPGNGKTPQAVVATNSDPGPVLVICPPFLKYSWEREFKKWANWGPSLEVVLGSTEKLLSKLNLNADVTIIPDSLVGTKAIQEIYRKKKFKWIFVDEAHRFKNDRAVRTVGLMGSVDSSVKGLVRDYKYLSFMSGTPMPSRPIELWPILSRFAPEVIDFMTKTQFAIRYCNGHEDQDGYWNDRGASNLDELGAKMFSKFMIRREKQGLPERIVDIIYLDQKALKAETRKFANELNKAYPVEKIQGLLAGVSAGGKNEFMGALSRLRSGMAESKAVETAKLANDFLSDNPDESLIIFCHHRETIYTLEDLLSKYETFVIDGLIDAKTKDGIQQLFQKTKKQQVIIAQMQAGGVGFTFTKAARIFIIEPSYVPGENDQAIDRIHRRTQDRICHASYIVFKDTLDEFVLNINFKKQKNLNQLYSGVK